MEVRLRADIKTLDMNLQDMQFHLELAAGYRSGAQRVRVLSEHWVGEHVVCPACGRKLRHYENNRPVADFFCGECQLDFELKSKKGSIKTSVPDGAYKSMIGRITSNTAPSFFFLQYDVELRVRNLFVTPAHYMKPELIRKRPALGPNAKRAGWEGCSIITKDIPASGRIFYVQDGTARPTDEICEQYRSTAFLANHTLETRGWLLDVMNCVESLGKPMVTLQELYGFIPRLALLHPQNRNIEAKIRQQLQCLRDEGYLLFTGRGQYKLARG